MINTLDIIFDPYNDTDSDDRLDTLKEQLSERKNTVSVLLCDVSNRSHELTVDQVGQKMTDLALTELHILLETIEKLIDDTFTDNVDIPARIAQFNTKLPQLISWLDMNRRLRGKDDVTLDDVKLRPIVLEAGSTNRAFVVLDVTGQLESVQIAINKISSIVESKDHKDEPTLNHRLELSRALTELNTAKEVLSAVLLKGSVSTIENMVALFNDKVRDVLDLMITNPRLWFD